MKAWAAASVGAGSKVSKVIREQLEVALRDAGNRGDQRALATLRLVMTALNERDFCAREAGGSDGLDDEAILLMLRSMVEQRRQNIKRCEESARLDFAVQEEEEITVLERFLPPKLGPEATRQAVADVIEELGAASLKDTGKVMSALKGRHQGQMDFRHAKKLVCSMLQ